MVLEFDCPLSPSLINKISQTTEHHGSDAHLFLVKRFNYETRSIKETYSEPPWLQHK